MVSSPPQTTELSVYEKISDPVAAIVTLGRAIARSGMFGCGSEEAGQVFAMECLSRRMPPLMLAERYHVIFGKLSMKAEAMLAGFEAEGGKYKVVERSPDRVAIEMSINGQTQTLSLTWEEALKEPFVYEGKEADIVDLLTSNDAKKLAKLKLKPKYATPRSRTQMLWARLVSDGVRFLCPSVVSGTYTPEEIDDSSDVAAGSNGSGHRKPATSSSVVESTVVESTVTETTPPAVPSPLSAPVFAQAAEPPAPSRQQIDRITQLYIDLGIPPETQAEILKRHGIGSLRSLPIPVAEKLLANLETKWKARQDQATAAAASAVAEVAPVPAPAGPCSLEQQAEIQELFKQYFQVDPAAAKAFKEELVKQRGPKDALKTLSYRDADRLKSALQNKQLANFFQQSLETWQPVKVDGEAVCDSVPFTTSG